MRKFFHNNANNYIKFWDCSSKEKWYLHVAVNKDSKNFLVIAFFSNMSSWDLSKKQMSDDIISQWKLDFLVSDDKEKSFLILLNSDSNPITPSDIKDRS